jgi:hypothetical protein
MRLFEDISREMNASVCGTIFEDFFREVDAFLRIARHSKYIFSGIEVFL